MLLVNIMAHPADSDIVVPPFNIALLKEMSNIPYRIRETNYALEETSDDKYNIDELKHIISLIGPLHKKLIKQLQTPYGYFTFKVDLQIMEVEDKTKIVIININKLLQTSICEVNIKELNDLYMKIMDIISMICEKSFYILNDCENNEPSVVQSIIIYITNIKNIVAEIRDTCSWKKRWLFSTTSHDKQSSTHVYKTIDNVEIKCNAIGSSESDVTFYSGYGFQLVHVGVTCHVKTINTINTLYLEKNIDLSEFSDNSISFPSPNYNAVFENISISEKKISKQKLIQLLGLPMDVPKRIKHSGRPPRK